MPDGYGYGYGASRRLKASQVNEASTSEETSEEVSSAESVPCKKPRLAKPVGEESSSAEEGLEISDSDSPQSRRRHKNVKSKHARREALHRKESQGVNIHPAKHKRRKDTNEHNGSTGKAFRPHEGDIFHPPEAEMFHAHWMPAGLMWPGSMPWGPYGPFEDEGDPAVDADAIDEQLRRHADREARVQEVRANERRDREDQLEKARERERQQKDAEAKRKELLAKQKAEAAKKYEEDMQQMAAWSIMQAIPRLSSATPATWNEVKRDFERTVASNLPRAGQRQESLRVETESALRHAEERVEQIRDAARKMQETIESQERNAKDALQALDGFLAIAEKASEVAYGSTAPLSGPEEETQDEPPKEDEADKLLDALMGFERIARDAISSCSTCADFLADKQPALDVAAGIQDVCMAKSRDAKRRLQVAAQRAMEALGKAIYHKAKIVKTKAAMEFERKGSRLFETYDVDKDGLLNREEISAFARGEYQFDIPDENLQRIYRQLVPAGLKGIEAAKFQMLKTAIGISREEARNISRRSCSQVSTVEPTDLHRLAQEAQNGLGSTNNGERDDKGSDFVELKE